MLALSVGVTGELLATQIADLDLDLDLGLGFMGIGNTPNSTQNLVEMARKAGTTKPTTAAQGQKAKAK